MHPRAFSAEQNTTANPLNGNASASQENNSANAKTPQKFEYVVELNIAKLTLKQDDNTDKSDGESTPKIDVDAIEDLLKAHLTIIAKRKSSRMTVGEWRRLIKQANGEIKSLLATEGFFSPKIKQQSEVKGNRQIVTFDIDPQQQAVVQNVSLNFTGEITTQSTDVKPSVSRLEREWRLKKNTGFSQKKWADAKQNLLTILLSNRYALAKIVKSQALVNPVTNLVEITLTVDSGPSVYFGDTIIESQSQYPEGLIRNINPIKAGDLYNQNTLLNYQAFLQETGKFNNVSVVTDLANIDANGRANVLVNVTDRLAKTLSFGVGASTNTGARIQSTYTNRNLFNRGLLWEATARLEQRAQSATSIIQFPTDAKGYRDSINNSVVRIDLEGQRTTAINNGVKRTWGNLKFEQFISANLLYEFLTVNNETEFNKSATVGYGFTYRNVNNDIAPTKGYIVNTQFQVAPLDQFSDGRFLQSLAKIQGFYKIAKNTQWIGRLEGGMVSGSQNVPATFLFRAGGDQSVRGYNFQSLGVNDGNAVLGGRVLLTGSTEVIQWLTPQWGAAVFIDFGNAAERWKDYEPVYGYGVGARWKSPVGPVGVDIAYGEAVDDYRIHFNLGVNF